MGSRPDVALAALERAADDGRLEELAERHGLSLVTVFGSAAAGAPDARDLDVAVATTRTRPLKVLPLVDDLAALTGSDDVDLLVLDRAGPVAREQALVRCVPLYQDAPGVFATAQMAAITERLDTDWLRRLDLERMAR